MILNEDQCVIMKTFLLPPTPVLQEALGEGSLLRFVMSGSLKIHYDVTALSEQFVPPHLVIIKDSRQDEDVIPLP